MPSSHGIFLEFTHEQYSVARSAFGAHSGSSYFFIEAIIEFESRFGKD